MTNTLKPIDEVRHSLTRMKEQFKAALPPQVDVDRFIRVTVTALQNQPALLDCNRQSLYGACMKAAQSGLLPDGQESAIVKYKDSAQFMPMIKGILKQVRNSGELLSIAANTVFRNDKFRYWIDSDGEHLEHEPNLFADRGERLCVYGIAKTKDGGVYIEVMTKEQVDSVKKVSRAKDGPWTGPFEEEMWRKTVLRRLSKRLPMSTDLEGLMKADDELFMPPPETPQLAAEPEPQPQKKASRTAKLVSAAVEKSIQAAPPSEEKREVKNYAPQTTALVNEESPPL